MHHQVLNKIKKEKKKEKTKINKRFRTTMSFLCMRYSIFMGFFFLFQRQFTCSVSFLDGFDFKRFFFSEMKYAGRIIIVSIMLFPLITAVYLPYYRKSRNEISTQNVCFVRVTN